MLVYLTILIVWRFVALPMSQEIDNFLLCGQIIMTMTDGLANL